MATRKEKSYELESLFRIVFKTFKNEINELFKDEVPSNQFLTLRLLVEKGPLRVSEISDSLQVSTSHITALTDQLFTKGYIERTRSNEDRRVVKISITDKGCSVVGILEKRKSEYFLEKFNTLTDEELNDLILLFKKLK
jgi:DNA-binding MarR family transcriptional regulator